MSLSAQDLIVYHSGFRARSNISEPVLFKNTNRRSQPGKSLGNYVLYPPMLESPEHHASCRFGGESLFSGGGHSVTRACNSWLKRWMSVSSASETRRFPDTSSRRSVLIFTTTSFRMYPAWNVRLSHPSNGLPFPVNLQVLALFRLLADYPAGADHLFYSRVACRIVRRVE